MNEYGINLESVDDPYEPSYPKAVENNDFEHALFLAKNYSYSFNKSPEENPLVILLEKIISYPALIDSMKLNARSSINSLTWEKYNEQVRKALNDIVL